MQNDTLNVVALSGGKDSTAMAIKLRQMEPGRLFTYVCTPTGDELPEMLMHWAKLEEILGQKIVKIAHNRGLNGLIWDQWALPNWRQRWCTRILKIEPYAAWLMQQTSSFSRIVSYVGIRADEPEREAGDYLDIPGVEMVFPLRELGWGITEVLDFLEACRITIPDRTDCARCFYQRLSEWYALWLNHFEIYADAASQERMTGFTFRSPGRDKWPTSLDALAAEFAAGKTPRGVQQDGKIMSACRVCRT